MRREGFCLDIEANGFFRQADKIWCIVIKDLQTGRKQTLYPFKESKESVIAAMKGWLSSYDTPSVVFHNGLGYDILVIKKLLDIDFNVGPDEMFGKPVQFIDTFYLSMYCNPDRDGHSIEYHGQQLGLEKIDYRSRAVELGIIEANAPDGAEFMRWHDEMGVYCERDVDVNIKVFHSLMDEFDSQYGKSDGTPAHYKCGQKNHYLMACQEITGWKFDLALAYDLQDKIQSMMFEIEQEVEPMLPPRKMKKGEEKEYSMPAKPYKANGDFSSHMLNFIEKHKGEVVSPFVVKFYGVDCTVESKKMLDVKLPMTLGNQDDLKDYLLEQGWKPTLWNYKKGPDNKPLRDPITRQLVPTTPKMQDQGKICENLLELEGDMVKKVVKWLSLRNRQSVLNGWVDNQRIAYDGRLSTGRTGITPTFRMKHSTVVNVPKASDKVLLGKEFRSLFICEDGTLIAAGDAAALEGRVMGHYTFKYDSGATAKEILEGDPHSKNAKVFYPLETKAFDINADDFNKDDVGFKPYRDRSKNVFYSLLYGAGPPKVASTLGKPESEGKTLYSAFWDANPAISQLKGGVENFWEANGKKFVTGIDGRQIKTRKKSALLNSLFQSCGAIAMEYAICFMDKWLGGIQWVNGMPVYIYKGYTVKRIGYYHDELEYECDDLIAEEVSKMIEKAITRAGEHLKLNVPLAGEGKIGKNWKEVH